MATYDQTIGEHTRRQMRQLKSCETPNCSTNCTYAYSCHEERMGNSNVIFWPLLALVLFGIVAGILNLIT